jgi:indoleamine 2,3-dioxygenase
MLAPLNRSLSEFDISPKTRFLSDELPLRRLPDSFYEPWEAIVEDLPELIKTVGIRERVDKLPLLPASKLRSEGERRRAYLLLSLITQGYIWAGEAP